MSRDLKVMREQAVFTGTGVGKGWLGESQPREQQGHKPSPGRAWLVRTSEKPRVARLERLKQRAL